MKIGRTWLFFVTASQSSTNKVFRVSGTLSFISGRFEESSCAHSQCLDENRLAATHIVSTSLDTSPVLPAGHQATSIFLAVNVNSVQVAGYRRTEDWVG